MADINEKLNELNNTPDTTGQYDPQDIQDNKIMAILAYLSWLVLIPLFKAKESKFARFHCNQGLLLAIGELVAMGVLNFLTGIPVIGPLFNLAKWVISIVCFFLTIVGISNAAKGRVKELPFVGSFRILK